MLSVYAENMHLLYRYSTQSLSSCSFQISRSKYTICIIIYSQCYILAYYVSPFIPEQGHMKVASV